MQTNCLAKAKLVLNKKINCYKLVIAFTHSKSFTQREASYVSGDLPAENLEKEVTRCLQLAESVLRTTNIQFVEE